MLAKTVFMTVVMLALLLPAAGPQRGAAASGAEVAELPPLQFIGQDDWYTNNNLPAEQFDGRTLSGRFNEDALSDIAVITGAGTIDVMPSSGSSFNPPAQWYDFAAADPAPGLYAGATVAGDFNNDGLDDVAAIVPYLLSGGVENEVAVYLSNGTNGFTRQQWALLESYYLEAKGRIVSGDFDGDGWHDDVALLFYNGQDTIIFVLRSDGSKFAAPQSWGRFDVFDSSRVTGRVVAGDFDADGLDDLAAIYEVPYDGTYRTRAYVFFSSGASFSRSTWWEASGYNAQEALGRVVAGDWDGDGDDDITLIYRYPSVTRAHVLLSTRYLEFIYQGNSGWWSHAPFVAGYASGRTVAGDWDGNGVDDIGMLYGADFLTTWVLMSTAVPPSSAETLYVDHSFAGCPTGSPFPDRFCTVQEAVNAARDGQRIEVAQGAYPELVNIPRYTTAGFNQEVTIAGAGIDATVLDGQNQGPVVAIGPYGRVSLSGLTVQNGTALEGGGIYTEGYLRLSSSRLTGNRAEEHGGALNSENDAVTFIVDSLLDGNTAQWGGAVSALYNSLTDIETSDLRGNIASDQGGALLIDGGDVVIRSSTFDDNLSYDGGAIYQRTAILNLRDSTLSRNQATHSAGALLVEDDGDAYLRQNTVSGSRATDSALVIDLAGRALILANTIAGNESGGISFWDTPNTRIGSTLLAGNAGGNCDISVGSNLVVTLGYNISTDDSCGFFAGNDQVVGDALLGPLRDNGGPTETMALQSGSPAIDMIPQANCGETPQDQRGVPRPQDGDDDGQALCDIGAFELLLAGAELYLPMVIR